MEQKMKSIHAQRSKLPFPCSNMKRGKGAVRLPSEEHHTGQFTGMTLFSHCS